MNLFLRLPIYLTFVITLSTYNIFSQEPATAQYDEYYNYADTTHKILNANSDEIKIDLRIPSEETLKIYKNDSVFDYENKLRDSEDWITKISSWINQQLTSLRYSDVYSTALDIFYYALILFALVIIVWGLIKGDRRFLFFSKSLNNEVKLTEQKEDINQLDFDEQITTAIENKNYKLAVRYLFLKSLKLLSDKELINLKKDKTNKQYLAEIKNIKLARAFRSALYRFEWIWYGDFPIDDDLMKNSKNEFNKLFGLIK
jgi:hypothetical protein